MALLKTPICDFGLNAIDFKLKSINGELLTLNDVKGENGTLIMFICNHCPYVKAIIRELADDCAKLYLMKHKKLQKNTMQFVLLTSLATTRTLSLITEEE